MSWICSICGKSDIGSNIVVFGKNRELFHIDGCHFIDPEETQVNEATQRVGKAFQEAKRNESKVRYDILYPPFENLMAMIGAYGAKTYGDFNWQKSRLKDDKSPINHIREHLFQYQTNQEYDHPEIGKERKIHLAAIAFNAMMEFWYEENFPESPDSTSKT